MTSCTLSSPLMIPVGLAHPSGSSISAKLMLAVELYQWLRKLVNFLNPYPKTRLMDQQSLIRQLFVFADYWRLCAEAWSEHPHRWRPNRDWREWNQLVWRPKAEDQLSQGGLQRCWPLPPWWPTVSSRFSCGNTHIWEGRKMFVPVLIQLGITKHSWSIWKRCTWITWYLK